MHIRASLLAAALAVLPLTLQATNPTIRVNGDPPDPTPVFSTSFAFGSDPNGGGLLSFINDSGQQWRSLDITFTLNRLTGINCTSDAFGACLVSSKPVPGTSDFSYALLFGRNGSVGILNGAGFSVDLNDEGTDPNGSGQWGKDLDFKAVANTGIAPEPSAIALLLTGTGLLGGLAFYRRRRCSAERP